jgi:hypothetical protein
MSVLSFKRTRTESGSSKHGDVYSCFEEEAACEARAFVIRSPLIRWQQRCMGNRDGEDYEAPTVDEGRCPHVEDARPRESKNDGDCAETEADSRRDP